MLQGMTPEQWDRIQRNKMKALEKKAARLGVPVASLSKYMIVSTVAAVCSLSWKLPMVNSSCTGIMYKRNSGHQVF